MGKKRRILKSPKFAHLKLVRFGKEEESAQEPEAPPIPEVTEPKVTAPAPEPEPEPKPEPKPKPKVAAKKTSTARKPKATPKTRAKRSTKKKKTS